MRKEFLCHSSPGQQAFARRPGCIFSGGGKRSLFHRPALHTRMDRFGLFSWLLSGSVLPRCQTFFPTLTPFTSPTVFFTIFFSVVHSQRLGFLLCSPSLSDGADADDSHVAGHLGSLSLPSYMRGLS